MSQTLHDLLVNRNDQTKKSDRFYVSFFAINQNVGNYLGAQVKTISRPAIDIDRITHERRGAQFNDTGHQRFQPISVTFSDDEESLTAMLLYAQVMRQKKKYRGELDHVFVGDGETYKFGVKIELYNSRGDVTEGYILRDCFVSEITHSQQIYEGAGANEITVSITYDNIEMKVFDRYIEMLI